MKRYIKKIIKETITNVGNNPRILKENGDLTIIKSLKRSIENKLRKVYKKVTGKELDLPKIDIKIDSEIKDGKIAGFNHPKKGKSGLMGIKPKALEDKEYLKWVITHELIHACVGKDLPKHKEHEGLFKKIADEMGLPKKYQD
mgnify:CR=1 FL=1|jgi:predicted SprT family Zn-dependent metalloprotease